MTAHVPSGSSPDSYGAVSKWRAFRRSTLGTVLLNVAAALVVIALVQTFFVKMYVVPSESMMGTLAVGDRILVNRTAYAGGVPPRGDVVVFTATGAWLGSGPDSGQDAAGPAKELVRYFGDVTGIGPSHEKFLVKRVIGIPGDVVTCCGAAGAVTVNGVAADEPYLLADTGTATDGTDCGGSAQQSGCFAPVTVPAGQLLVLGDNRGNSNDSVYDCRGRATSDDACLKFVPLESVVGHAFWKVLPLNRMGAIR